MTSTAIKNQDDPRVIRTRKLIIESFVSLLGEKDFGSITVQDIAAQATVNRATFYAHFDDKYDLVFKMTGERFRSQLDNEVPKDSALSRSTLNALNDSVASFLDNVFGHCHLNQQLSSIVEAAMHETLRFHIELWLNSRPAATIDREGANVIAVTVSSALIGSRLAFMRRDSAEHVPEQTIRVVDVLSQGVLSTA